MTFISATRPAADPRFSVRNALSHAMGVWRQRQALRSLDARALADIGLSRAEADAEAGRPFWDAPETWRS